MTQIQFDARTVAPSEAIEAIPAGWYIAMAETSEMKPTKLNDGFYLEMTFKVLDGQYINRKLWTRLNLRNSNPQAQEIAYRELSAICHATGRLVVGDSAELHNIPLKIKVKVKPGDGQYEASNEITGYKNVNEPTGAQAAPAPAAPWAGAPAAPAVAPAPAAAPAGPVSWPGQPAPAAAPVAAPAPAWQPPAAAQPWTAAPATAAPAPAAPAPAAPAAAHPAQAAQPAWMAAPAPGAGATPPWAAPK